MKNLENVRKSTNTLLAPIACALLLSTGIVSESWAACSTTSIACGDDCAANDGVSSCHWEIDANGKLSITGSGAMKENAGNRSIQENTKAPDGKLTTAASYGDYWQQITSIEIGEGIKNTGDRAFQGLTNVTSVSIPTSLENIGHCAFDRMPSMNSFNIPEGSKLTTLSGQGAFQFSSSLTDIQNIIDTLVANNKANGNTFSIPDNAFRSNGATSLVIPEGSYVSGTYGLPSTLESLTVLDSNQLSSISALPYGLKSLTIPDDMQVPIMYMDINNPPLKITCIGDTDKCKSNITPKFDICKNRWCVGYSSAINQCEKYGENPTYNFCSDLGMSCCEVVRRTSNTLDNIQPVSAETCNNLSGHYYTGENCAKRPEDGVLECAAGFYTDHNDYCDKMKLRYTLQEADAATSDDNENMIEFIFM